MDALTAHKVDLKELAKVDEVAASLPDDSALGYTLRQLSDSVRAGQDVVLASGRAELTPSQAAKWLGMSRTHLYKLLDQADIPAVRVGRDRRVRMTDLVTFDKRRQEDRANLAARFAHASTQREALVQELARDSRATGEGTSHAE